MAVVSYGSEAWNLQKTEQDILDVFQRKSSPLIVLVIGLTDCISNSKLTPKIGSMSLSRVTMRKRLRWIEHVLRKKDDRLSLVILVGQPSRATRKSRQFPIGVEDVVTKHFRKMETSWEGVKRGDWNRIKWRSMRSYFGLRCLSAAVSC